MYGSLTNRIRDMIKNYKQITSSTMRRDAYIEFLRRLRSSAAFSDVTFDVHGRKFPAHKCVLCARSGYFANMFETKWKDRDVISLNNKLVSARCFLFTSLDELFLKEFFG